jgi:hypothetical protein
MGGTVWRAFGAAHFAIAKRQGDPYRRSSGRESSRLSFGDRPRKGAGMRRHWKLSIFGTCLTALSCATIAAPVPALAATSNAVATTIFTPLSLQNGWFTAPFGNAKPAVGVQSGVVYLKGAMATSGTNPTPFTLPVAARPGSDVFVPVDLCTTNPGVLHIQRNGIVTVQALGGAFANAQCFTSLDGVSYALRAPTALALQNGWTNAPFATSNAAAELVSGIVHLKGAVATTGTNPVPFTLPPRLRPPHDVYVRVDMCNANTGRLFIQASTGTVTVETPTSFSNAACFTSLDGASYVLHAPTALTLQNGWTNAPFNTSNAAGELAGGIVHLQGAVATTGTNPQPFTMPVALRPKHTVFVPLDLCSSNVGAIEIEPNGTATVQALGGAFSNAQCFTSLDGAVYAR